MQPEKPVLGLDDLSRRSDKSVEQIRKRIRTDPVLAKMFTKIGTSYVAESAALPAIKEQLEKGKKS